MNDIRDVSPIQQDHIQQGVEVLQQRRNKMRIYMVLSSIVVMTSLVGLLFNQDLVYAFLGISTSVQQLHVPVSAAEVQQQIGESRNYFGQLLSWVMWFGLKILVAVIGASLFVHYAKKIEFFRRRMQSFLRRCFVWLLSVVLIWSGLSWLQADLNEDGQHTEEYAEFIAYKQHIQHSEIYRYLERSKLEGVVQNYLLAQTALLHQPTDDDTALAYTAKLIQAEKQDSHFLAYGFKPEQLWAMQYQLYGKAVTPLAQTVQQQMTLADRMVNYSQWALLFALAVFSVFAFIFYALTRQFNTRLSRIENRLK